MYLQIINHTLAKNNQIQATTETIGQTVRKAGWNLKDCTFQQIRDELIETKYRGVDGKSIAPGKKQYRRGRI